MKENFIKILQEEAINNMEVNLAVQAISDEINDMIAKLTNLKIKDIADLVQKIKFDDSVDKANEFQNMMVEKIDTVLQTMTEVKGSIDDYVAKSMKGEDANLSIGDETASEPSDMEKSFEFDEEEPSEMSDEEAENTEDTDDKGMKSIEDIDAALDDLNLDSLDRKKK